MVGCALYRMLCRATIILIALACPFASVSSQDLQASTADTLLVLKNGAEVRGLFLGLKDGQYTLRLPDGRTMTYPAGDVDRIERLVDSAPSTPPAAPQPIPAPTPFSCRTFISEKDADKAFYTTIKDIKVSKKWYGSTSEMYGELAEKARKTGADAVINVHTWQAPSGFAWAAPHAGGMAVKWTEAGRKALPSLEGRCY
jgi:hypothetical protein